MLVTWNIYIRLIFTCIFMLRCVWTCSWNNFSIWHRNCFRHMCVTLEWQVIVQEIWIWVKNEECYNFDLIFGLNLNLLEKGNLYSARKYIFIYESIVQLTFKIIHTKLLQIKLLLTWFILHFLVRWIFVISKYWGYRLIIIIRWEIPIQNVCQVNVIHLISYIISTLHFKTYMFRGVVE